MAVNKSKAFREPTKTKALDSWYRKRLKAVAAMVASIALAYDDTLSPFDNAQNITRSLFSYTEQLDQWAKEVANTMIERAARADYDVWLKVLGKDMTQGVKDVFKSVDKGPSYIQLMTEEVQLIKSIPMDAAQKVHEWTTHALETGERPETIAKRIREELPDVTENKATLIARTETARARSVYTQVRAEAIGSEEYIWHTVGDASVRHTHAKLNGKVCRWDDPPETDFGKGGEPLHNHPGRIWNCFTGDTLVCVPSDLLKIIRAPFDGRVIDIGTAFAKVSVTPNHPMLTQRGWVSASEIREGDYLLQAFGNAVEMVESDENQLVARLDDLFDAFSSEVKTTTRVHFDFYGDIPNGDVDTSVIESGLGFDIVTEARKRLSDFGFTWPPTVVRGVGHNAHNVGFAGFLRKISSFLKRSPSHSHKHCFGGVTGGDIAFFQATTNGPSVNAETVRDCEFTLSAEVTADDLSRVEFFPIDGLESSPVMMGGGVYTKRTQFERQNIGTTVDGLGGKFNCVPLFYKGFRVNNLFDRNFVGHVYTLETKKGWYGVTKQNYIVKNCRCWAEPLYTKSKFEF